MAISSFLFRRTRRAFVNNLFKGVASFGVAATSGSISLAGEQVQEGVNHDSLFDFLTGKHKMVFDAVTVNDGYSVIWPYTYLQTNNDTGTPDQEMNALIVFRARAVPLALPDKLWSKYKLGKLFKIIDYKTNTGSERNLYWDPSPGEMPDEGMTIKALQGRGVRFCVCEKAIELTSKQIAKSKGGDPLAIKDEFISGLLPGMTVVPSGVWAIDRAQERGCSYCAAG